MIKVILLIFKPGKTWERIVLAGKGFLEILFLFLFPLLVLSVGCEVVGVFYFGKHHEMGQSLKLSGRNASIYGAVDLLLNFALVFINAQFVKSISETFHTRHTFEQTFTVVAYTLSPLFLINMLNAIPAMPLWVTFAVGIILSLGVLYQGVPKVIQPDPPHAFGLYLTSVLMLAGTAALARFLSLLVLSGKIKLF